MADSHPTRLFDDWAEIESDFEYVHRVMEELGLGFEFADLPASSQKAVLAMALAKKRAWRTHLTGRA